jgi:hypothetical protein
MSAPPLSMASHSAASLSRAAHSSMCQPRLSCATFTDIQVCSKLTFNRCCGSEIFHPGSRAKKIPDPGSRSIPKYSSIFNPKKVFKLSEIQYLPGCSFRIRILIFTHPGSRIQGQKGTGSWIRIRNTDFNKSKRA